MSGTNSDKPPSRTFYRRRVELFALIDKIKLWPSRKGILHGIKAIDVTGNQARITTHCERIFVATNSRNSRAARWLRNKWHRDVCRVCGIPQWKLEKYSATFFKNEYGSDLRQRQTEEGGSDHFASGGGSVKDRVDSKST